MGFDGRLYTAYLEPGLDRLGVRTHLSSLYWALGVPGMLFRLSSQETATHAVNGVTVEFPIETRWQYERFRWMHPEIRLFEELVDELGPGDVFYDVGAHLGWHSVVAANAADDVTVEAFEPHPQVADRLRTVVDATGHSIAVRECALADRDGTAEFEAEPTPAAALSGAQDDPPASTVEVALAAGDSLVAEGAVEPPDILKIDAEGADAAVLSGLQETIAAHRPRRIYCEVHVDGDEIRELLSSFGYSFEPIASTRPVLRAVPK
ncbi:FkbM family methyltransferase [Natronomonas pharaonis DSM 2160]|uniref:FkbM family methyltransferase n=1 Tax=Natronomonas pharaonis (strain ATCC 35678 / DSM 2160 / CIP 103997 / JCM 8858 / NBRC 14720 / NCIMB 2260 / Gabara) TaxID=348780 RepID=A0A1U7EXK0_NATPD|nr:FkbM family methyltransferase [Natronomonas pharaonis]CAI49904.1 FkbM family methyltransferase [Natronomonas pharaonis DSM 2160]